MASRRSSQSPLPPYSRRPAVNEQVLAVAPDFPLAVEAIQVVQEWFPGTNAGDAWEFIQQLAHIVRADARSRRDERTRADHGNTSGSTTENGPSSAVPKDSPMPDAT